MTSGDLEVLVDMLRLEYELDLQFPRGQLPVFKGGSSQLASWPKDCDLVCDEARLLSRPC